MDFFVQDEEVAVACQLMKFALFFEPFHCDLPFCLETLHFVLTCLDAVSLLDSLLVALLDVLCQLVYFFDVLVAADDIFQVFQEASLILGQSFRLHQGDLLDFALQDEESVVVQVNTFLAQQFSDDLVVLWRVIDVVLRG